MSTFRLSLRALSHPLSLVAIGVLLLNDHWLKADAPSALTGKVYEIAAVLAFVLVAVLRVQDWPKIMRLRREALTPPAV